jgi:hypothetical protein
VIPLTGPFVGQVGVIDELDETDPENPFRVRFEQYEGEPVRWFSPVGLRAAAVYA